MNNEFVPYEQALALKELGFNEPCLTWWYKDEFVKPYWERELGYTYESGISKDCVLAPLYQQAFRWFRENYNLRGQIISDYDKFSYQIYSKVDNEYHLIKGGSCDQEYEEAELECLKELIEIVKNLKQQ
jgi:hypothetical protein